MNPHRPGSPESPALELDLLATRADLSRAILRLHLADHVHAVRMDLGQPSRREDRLAEARTRHIAAMRRVAVSHSFPVACPVCHEGIHHDGGLMCAAHEGALTHHYCINGCAAERSAA